MCLLRGSGQSLFIESGFIAQRVAASATNIGLSRVVKEEEEREEDWRVPVIVADLVI